LAKQNTKPKIALYKGPGAELVNDVAKAIQSKFPFRLLGSSEIRAGLLEEFNLLIMPGGYTARYLPALRPKGCAAITHFLTDQGGCYLGICAGAYLAGPEQLGICQSRMIRHSGLFNCFVTIQDRTHSIFSNLKTDKLEIYYQNGPHIILKNPERSLAQYSDGTTSLLETSHALIFSWHPEKLPHTTPILWHSINYLLSVQSNI